MDYSRFQDNDGCGEVTLNVSFTEQSPMKHYGDFDDED